MNFKIFIIIGVVAVVFIIALITFLSITNKRKSKQLQDNLTKYKQQNKEEENTSISLSTNEVGQNISEEELFSDDFKEPEVEEKIDDFKDFDFNFDDFLPKTNFKPRDMEEGRREDRPRSFNENSFPRRPDHRRIEREKKARDDDFEQFLNEHSFTRKVFDKSLLSQIKKMPPEIKAVIMSNVFDKFHDDDI